MNITVQQGEIQKRTDAAVVINLFEGAKLSGATAAMDRALSGLVRTVLKGGDFSGKKNQIIVLYTQDRALPRRVVLVGLGKRAGDDPFHRPVGRGPRGICPRLCAARESLFHECRFP